MSDNKIAIRVENLSKRYRIGLKEEMHDTFAGALVDNLRRPVHNLRRLRRLTRFSENGDKPGQEADDIIWALKDISFEVKRGEVVGIIGRNGAGKSTLLKILSRITYPTSGRVELKGRVSSLLEVGTGFHSELTGRENIYLNGTILGMRKAEIDRKFDEIVDFSGVEKFIDTPVKRYSSGMRVRLAFSVSAHLEPEILLVDEVLAVGDADFQQKCLGKMEDVANKGRTVLFVSHNMGSILEFCKTAIFLHGGLLEARGETSQIVCQYKNSFQGHPAGVTTGHRDKVWFGAIKVGQGKDHVIVSGEPIEFETTFGFDSTVLGFQLFCIVKDAKGERLVHDTVKLEEIALTEYRNDEYSIKIFVPPLWLNPGVYTIYFRAIVKGLSHTQGGRYSSQHTPFSVVGKTNPKSVLLNPPIKWTLRRRSEGSTELSVSNLTAIASDSDRIHFD